jgi:hypothetical protein
MIYLDDNFASSTNSAAKISRRIHRLMHGCLSDISGIFSIDSHRFDRA